MIEITGRDIVSAVDSHDRNGRQIKVVANGELAVLIFEDRTFLFNRMNGRAYELKPDFEIGLTVHCL